MCVCVKTLPTSSRNEADRRSRQQAGVQLSSVHSLQVNPEVVHRIRAQAHLLEDGSDVVLEETIEAPRHFERTTKKCEGSGKLAMVVRVAQVKTHVSAREDSLLQKSGEFSTELLH